MDPTEEQLAALSADRPGEPVVMLNLVALREDALDGSGSGWDAYVRYSQAFVPLLRKVGGTILWAGDVTGVAIGGPDDDWDYAVLVRYPSRQAFVDTMTSPEYAEASVDRHQGLRKHLILPVAETFSKFATS